MQKCLTYEDRLSQILSSHVTNSIPSPHVTNMNPTTTCLQNTYVHAFIRVRISQATHFVKADLPKIPIRISAIVDPTREN